MRQIATEHPPMARACTPMADASDTPLRVVLWGTYDLSKPRTRILRDGLLEIGVEVTEIHADVWSCDQDKSQLSHGQMILRLLQLIMAYPLLIIRYLRTPPHDLVIVPYLGQFDVIVLWPLAKLRGSPVILDMFLSLYDTVVNDRKSLRPASGIARCLKAVEWLSCRAADRVFLDTQTHARRIAALFNLAPEKVDAVPVGAEPGAFAHVKPRRVHDGKTRVLFYGQLIPLHGVQTILHAALSDQGKAYHWHIIGSGQEQALVAEALEGTNASNVTWDPWVPYSELARAIEASDICLGIFGTSDKAASVVPNKVYQSLFAQRPVITRDSPAMREVFTASDPGLRLVPAAAPQAIITAIAALETEGFPTLDTNLLASAQPATIAESLREKIAPLAGRTR